MFKNVEGGIMKPKQRQALSIGMVLLVTTLVFGGMLWLIVATWHRFVNLNPSLAAGLLTASSTILVATLTVALGRYLERKKEIEAHYREKKSAIYDSFLLEFFKVFHSASDNPSAENPELVAFLREWQRQVILWGGSTVLTVFLKWWEHLKKGKVDAMTLFLMEDFFLAVRRDLGLSNRGLQRGSFIRLMLKHTDVFFALANDNPYVLLTEVAAKEKELGIES
jgi:hypothetical protein